MTPAELLAAVLALSSGFAGTDPAQIGSAVEAQFSRVEETAYMTVWEAEGRGPVAHWELRLPKEGATFGGLLIADFAPPGVRAAEFGQSLAKLGPGEVIVVSPEFNGADTLGVPTSTCHSLKEGRLCLGWSNADTATAIALALETF